MNVVNPTNTTHTLSLIPRYYVCGTVDLFIYNESTQVETNVSNLYLVEDGYLTLTFDFNFTERYRYQYRLVSDSEIIYRGLIFATSQEVENYLTDNNTYTHYE
jgi:hypothetical protein